MIPKEKAFELVNKFSPLLPFYSVMDSVNKSKQCALIAVNELIMAFTQLSKEEIGTTLIDYGQSYWKEVKQEIEKL